MPKISRIRLVNLKYGKKEEMNLNQDCRFECMGKNTILQLVNTGGKTTTLLAIIQAVNPNGSIGKDGATVKNTFFSHNLAPMTSMIEFEMENGNGYVTAMTSFRYKADRDSVEYFSVLIKRDNVDRSSPFDIYSDAIVKTPQADKFEDWLKMKEKIRNFKSEDPYAQVQVFDKRESYVSALAEYGIFSDESSIFSKYTDEDGLADYLRKANNTSEKLIYDWALPTITSCFPDRDPAGEKNVEAFLNFVRDKAYGFRFYDELPLYEQLLSVMGDTEKLALQIQDPITDVIDSQSMLACTYSSLEYTAKDAEEKTARMEADAETLRGEIDDVEWLDVSRQYYAIEDRKNEAASERDLKQAKLDALTEEKKRIEEDLLMQDYARIYERMLAREEEKRGHEESMGRTDDEKVKELNVLSSTLWEIINEKVASAEEKVAEIEEAIRENETKRDFLAKELEEKRGTVKALSSELGGLKVKREDHLSYTKKLQEEGIDLPARNMMDAPYDSSTLSVKMRELDDAYVGKTEECGMLEGVLSETREEIRGAENAAAELRLQIAGEEKLIEEKTSEMKACAEERVDCEERFTVMLHIDSELSRTVAEEAAGKRRRELSDAHARLKQKEEEYKEHLNRISSGTFLANDTFAKYLDEKGYPYDTGENILSKMGVSERRRKLEEIPYYASAYFVREDVHEQIMADKEALCERNIGMVVLMTGDEPHGNASDILALYKTDIIDRVKREKMIHDLRSSSELCRESLAKNEEASRETEYAIQMMRKYYDLTDRIALLDNVISEKREHAASLQEKVRMKEIVLEDLGRALAEFEEKLLNAKKEAEELAGTRRILEDFSEREAEYAKNYDRFETLSSKNDLCEQEIDEMSESLAKVHDELDLARQDRNHAQNHLKGLRGELSEYSNVTEERAEGDYSRLRPAFIALRDAIRETISGIKSKIEACDKMIRDCKEEMEQVRFRSIRKGDPVPAYSESLSDRLEQKKMIVEKDVKEKEQTLLEAELAFTKANTEMDIFRSRSLKGKAPAPRSEVDFEANYENELDILKSELCDMDARIDVYEEVVSKAQNLRQRIEYSVQDNSFLENAIDMTVIEPDEFDETEEGIKQYIDTISLQKSEVDRILSELLETAHRELSKDYKGMDHMNVSSAIHESQINKADIKSNYERLLEASEKLRSYLMTVKEALKSHIEQEKAKYERFDQEYNELIGMLYTSLRREMEDIRTLSSKSTYRVRGVDRKTIKITEPKGCTLHGTGTALSKEEDDKNIEILSHYIRTVADSVIKADQNEQKEMLQKKLSNKALFGLFMENRGWNVQILKLTSTNAIYEFPPKNGGNFSGAEATVASFFLMITEISYKRQYKSQGVEGSFMFLDNPFGDMNHKDGVEALVSTADKGGIQLFATTGHTSTTILEAFDNLYIGKVQRHGTDRVLRYTAARLHSQPAAENGGLEQISFLS